MHFMPMWLATRSPCLISLLRDQGPTPCCHQHAGDTTLHAAAPADVGTLLQQAVQPFCAASAAKPNVDKSRCVVVLCALQVP